MKKLLLALCFLFSINLSAQDYEDVGWYSYGWTMAESWIFNTNYFRSHIFPDSTVQVEFSDGMGYVWMHGFGQVCDPTSGWFDDGYTVTIEENEPYMVDSIRVWYRYFRNQFEAEDTLKIQFYTEDDFVDFYEDPWEGNETYEGRSYGRIAYDTTLLKSPSSTMEFEELLDQDDVFEGITSKAWGVGQVVEPGEVIGMSCQYFPGNPYNVNDTLDNYMEPLPSNLLNNFVMYYWRDYDLTFETGIYNHAIIARTSARYNISTNGWNGQYWPGIASGGGLYHCDVDFYISKGTFIEEVDNQLELHAAFPNPATDQLNIQFSLESNDYLTFKILDTMGREVLVENWGNQGQGKQQTQVDLSALASGTYTYVLLTDRDQLSGKLVVQ